MVYILIVLVIVLYIMYCHDSSVVSTCNMYLSDCQCAPTPTIRTQTQKLKSEIVVICVIAIVIIDYCHCHCHVTTARSRTPLDMNISDVHVLHPERCHPAQVEVEFIAAFILCACPDLQIFAAVMSMFQATRWPGCFPVNCLE